MLLLTLACNDGGDATPTDSDAVSTDVTWYADIEPITYQKCATCHEDGGVGPGDWTSYEEASAAGPAIAAWVGADAMPLPAADPECRPYIGHERMNLTDDEKAALIAWGEGGAPLGDEADQTPGLVVPSTTLSDTNASLPMISEHTLTLDGSGNQHWCQVLENPFDETTYVTGIDVELGNREVVHHMVLAIDQGGDAGIEYGTDGTEPEFACTDPVVESDWLLIHAWTPGMEPVEFPEGMGYTIQPGDQLVLQMHYFGDPSQTYTDRSTYKLRTVDEIDQEVGMFAFGPTRFTIEAGNAEATAQDGMTNNFGVDFQVLGAFPHMHTLGRRFHSYMTDAETKEESCVIEGPYDFDHQMTYMFEDPMTWKQGDRLKFQCTWDNSDGTEDVSFGEGTDEEMCFMLFYYTF